jgi:uncharacterized membrane-anchored protein
MTNSLLLFVAIIAMIAVVLVFMKNQISTTDILPVIPGIVASFALVLSSRSIVIALHDDAGSLPNNHRYY